MIDEKILDEILPVPDINDLKEETIAELESEGFVITNFSTGGIFNMLIMIAFQIRIELVKLIRTVLNGMFIKHSSDTWLDLKSEEFSKSRKQATKTQGYVTVSRTLTDDSEAVKVPKGTVFKTKKDINGDELRYFTLDDAVLQQTAASLDILVEAENSGTDYNVPQGQITKSLVYFEGIDDITNKNDWITKEGSDIEDDESLRERNLNSWAELSARPIALKYKNICEAVEGVLYVRVDQSHPRGQGTVDIIVTGTAGEATEALLQAVRVAADTIKGEYDNILVKSSTTVTQNVDITIIIPDTASDDGILEKANAIIVDLFKISKNRKMNELLHMELIFALKEKMTIIDNIKINQPTTDIILDNDKVIILGNVTINITRN